MLRRFLVVLLILSNIATLHFISGRKVWLDVFCTTLVILILASLFIFVMPVKRKRSRVKIRRAYRGLQLKVIKWEYGPN